MQKFSKWLFWIFFSLYSSVHIKVSFSSFTRTRCEGDQLRTNKPRWIGIIVLVFAQIQNDFRIGQYVYYNQIEMAMAKREKFWIRQKHWIVIRWALWRTIMWDRTLALEQEEIGDFSIVPGFYLCFTSPSSTAGGKSSRSWSRSRNESAIRASEKTGWTRQRWQKTEHLSLEHQRISNISLPTYLQTFLDGSV